MGRRPALPARLERWQPRFGSLHARLLAAFTLIIVLTLVSAGAGVVWLVQEYRTRLAVDHLTELAMVASLSVRQLERQEARPEEIAAFVASQLASTNVQDVHVLVLDAQARVLAERVVAGGAQEPSFAGRLLEAPPRPAALSATPAARERRPFVVTRPVVWTGVVGVLRRPYIFVMAGPGGMAGAAAGPPGDQRGEALDRFVARQPAYRIALAVPRERLGAAWRELAPGLQLAAAIAVAASVAAALWLSRSITRPLRRITRAADAIARGDYRHQIPVEGTDEVAHLAHSFNTMSREVERSHQTLRDFVANASHELRTPLTSIQGFSQALVEGAVRGPEGAVEAGRIINEEAERMRALVEDLLYLSRVEAKEVTADRRPVDVAAVVRQASRRLQVTAGRRGLRVVMAVPDLPPVPGDADQLEHLFGNLLDNAGKYTPEGGAITVTGRAASGQALISVHNTGSYIPPEDLPHVFDRFYRVDKSRARQVEGSGLGLAIAREVAHRHGGRIHVQSDRETGTTFSVALPIGGDSLPSNNRKGSPRVEGTSAAAEAPAPAAA